LATDWLAATKVDNSTSRKSLVMFKGIMAIYVFSQFYILLCYIIGTSEKNLKGQLGLTYFK
jgi:hypothetical protein